jgi:hypothetical protein
MISYFSIYINELLINVQRSAQSIRKALHNSGKVLHHSHIAPKEKGCTSIQPSYQNLKTGITNTSSKKPEPKSINTKTQKMGTTNIVVRNKSGIT